MKNTIESLHARLLNLAREKNIEFQVLLNRLGAEQFLVRLALSKYVKQFVFKGGSLLVYLIDSERKTKDLDFSVTKISNQVDEVIEMIKSILQIPVDDGFKWIDVRGTPLNHPEMEVPGVRLSCHFLLGNMKGIVRMDLAYGNVIGARKTKLERIRYRNNPIFGNTVSLYAYTPEAIFAEKLCIVIKKQGQNTRMKDYYDLYKLIDSKISSDRLKKCIEKIFKRRNIPLRVSITFSSSDLERLQIYWEHFLKRDKPKEVPEKIIDVITKINSYLKKLYR